MTVNELIEILKKFDGNLEIVSAIDSDAYSEDIEVYSVEERDFEVDNYHRALVFKSTGYMPERCDWNNQSRKGIFMYNGRDDVTWDELPIEVRKRDYPYYFNKKGEDCYPYRTDI